MALLGFWSMNVQPLHLHGFANIAALGCSSALVKTGYFVKAFAPVFLYEVVSSQTGHFMFSTAQKAPFHQMVSKVWSEGVASALCTRMG